MSSFAVPPPWSLPPIQPPLACCSPHETQRRNRQDVQSSTPLHTPTRTDNHRPLHSVPHLTTLSRRGIEIFFAFDGGDDILGECFFQEDSTLEIDGVEVVLSFLLSSTVVVAAKAGGLGLAGVKVGGFDYGLEPIVDADGTRARYAWRLVQRWWLWQRWGKKRFGCRHGGCWL